MDEQQDAQRGGGIPTPCVVLAAVGCLLVLAVGGLLFASVAMVHVRREQAMARERAMAEAARAEAAAAEAAHQAELEAEAAGTTWVHPARALSLVLPAGWREVESKAPGSFTFQGPQGAVVALALEPPLTWPAAVVLATDEELEGRAIRAFEGGGVRLELSVPLATREAVDPQFEAILRSLAVPAR